MIQINLASIPPPPPPLLSLSLRHDSHYSYQILSNAKLQSKLVYFTHLHIRLIPICKVVNILLINLMYQNIKLCLILTYKSTRVTTVSKLLISAFINCKEHKGLNFKKHSI